MSVIKTRQDNAGLKARCTQAESPERVEIWSKVGLLAPEFINLDEIKRGVLQISGIYG